MESNKHALVLTGETLAGFDAASVWPKLAQYFRMEPARLQSELLARAPITIKESEDLAKLGGLRDGAASLGAASEVHPMAGGPNLFVLVDGVPRGPVPHAFVDARVRSGAWQAGISVAEVGSSNWRPFQQPAAAAPAFDQQATVAFSTMSAADLSASAAATPASAAQPMMRAANPAPAASAPAASASMGEDGQLPEGLLVHAGFWRRFAAYTADSLILMIPMLLIFGLLGYMAFKAAMSGDGSGGMLFFLYFLAYVGAIVGSWLYFAKYESGAGQATIGKRLMGLKVTNVQGERISFGRATGRFFGKMVTGLIPFGIGWMLAGWTGRKQAIHDMMCSTCVVFKEVEPGRPMPTTRPPMPWYGWVLNLLPFILSALMFIGYGILLSMLFGSASRGMQSEMSGIDMSGLDGSISQDMGSMSSSGVDAGEREVIRTGLTSVYGDALGVQGEIASAVESGGECPTEDRPSGNTWIDSIQLGGVTPNCTLTVRLSSSSDIPFAARIERIEWTLESDGNWSCQSSMASDLLPFACN